MIIENIIERLRPDCETDQTEPRKDHCDNGSSIYNYIYIYMIIITNSYALFRTKCSNSLFELRRHMRFFDVLAWYKHLSMLELDTDFFFHARK